jgi:NAD(P)-dependent dehydrogenase (short-subunit alcohol dehydrogenase family)
VADGVKNIAIVDITHERLLPAVSSLAAIDPSATVLQIGADCSQEAEVEAAVSKTVETFGRLDVCFNAAGMSGDIKPMAEQSSSNLDNVLGLNLKGVWYCQRAQIKQMLKQEMRDVT